MKIANIVPGFGGSFYCGNCLRDNVYIQSLQQLGHESTILPVYLPMSMEGFSGKEEIPVFYSAVSIYLKQQVPFLRKMPAWLERYLNSAPIMKLAANKSGSTRARGLEKLTLSMLLGQEGRQKEELKQLVEFLKNHEKPDVVHLSNALMTGMARQIRDEVKVPVVVTTQDEDVWIDALKEPYREKIWQLLSEKIRDVDAVIAVSEYYAGFMKDKLKIPDEKIHVVHIGVQPELYTWTKPSVYPRAIGFLSRMNHENGLDILVDAFIRMKRDPRFIDLRLKLSGGMTNDDRPFFKKQMRKLKRKKLDERVDFFDDFSVNGLKEFFESLTLLSVPVLKGEAFGIYQIEALASGVPLIQPEIGAFPEIIKATGGGLLYSPNTSEALAERISGIISDKFELNAMSTAGQKAVAEKFDCRKQAAKLVAIYETVRF
jgi:glycosyltransferase involved in cell wall biosynthesis